MSSTNCLTSSYSLPIKAVHICINKDTFPGFFARFDNEHRGYTCPYSLSINALMKPEFCCYSGAHKWSVKLRNDKLPYGNQEHVQDVDLLANVSTWIDKFDAVFVASKFPMTTEEAIDLFDKVGDLETWVWVPTHVLN